MTTKYYAILTAQGAAKLANATMLGTQLQITQMALGDGGGTLPTPNASQTALIGEKRRAPLNALSIDSVNTSQIIAEQVVPEDVGGWWIREMGLFDADGVLIAVANCPETYKPQLQEGSGRTQTVRMVLIISSTDAVTLKIDPAVVLATRKYVDDKVIEGKAYTDAQKDSPAFTGKPTAPTAAKTDSSKQLANTEFVKAAIAGLLGGASSDLDTLKKLADALAGKMDISKNGADINNISVFLKNLGLGDGSALPVGVPVPWPLSVPPNGWLKYNGASFDKVANPKLAAIYPSGVLPDLRGEFIRGWDDGRGVDNGRSILASQKGSYLIQESASNVDRVVQFSINDIALLGWDKADAGSDALRARSTGDASISTWTARPSGNSGVQYLGYSRPRNIAFNYIVRSA